MKELPILQIDPLLRPYQGDLALRMENYRTRLAALLPDGQDLASFADGAAYFGFHRAGGRLVVPGVGTGRGCDVSDRRF